MFIDIVVAVVMIFIGAYGVFEMTSLPPLRGEGVGPAFYPTGLSIVLIALSALLIFNTYRAKRDNPPSSEGPDADQPSDVVRPSKRHRPQMLVVATVAYIALFEIVGFPLLTVALLLFLSYILEPTGMTQKALFAVGFTVVAWLVFDSFLGLPLPLGVLDLR